MGEVMGPRAVVLSCYLTHDGMVLRIAVLSCRIGELMGPRAAALSCYLTHDDMGEVMGPRAAVLSCYLTHDGMGPRAAVLHSLYVLFAC